MTRVGNGQVAPRGWIVVALVVIVSAVAGWNAGGSSGRGVYVTWETKGDRQR